MPRKKVTTSENAVDADNSVLTDIIVDSLNKKIGDVAYIMGKGESPAEVKEWLSTGSTVLDTIISNDLMILDIFLDGIYIKMNETEYSLDLNNNLVKADG